MKWEELCWPEIQGLSKSEVVLFPIAAVEQHGPHLPLGTDAMITSAIAEELGRQLNGKILILPTQKVGCSHHHLGFPGTLSFSHETFAAAVLETVASVIKSGFQRILILNGHGGNQAIGDVIAEKAAHRWPESQIIVTSWWRAAAERLRGLVEGQFPSVGHACEFETSLMLVFRPELVDLSSARDDGRPPEAKQLQGDLVTRKPTATLSIPFDKLTEKGVYGRPTLATREKGERILAGVVSSLKELVSDCFQ